MANLAHADIPGHHQPDAGQGNVGVLCQARNDQNQQGMEATGPAFPGHFQQQAFKGLEVGAPRMLD